MSPGLLQLEGTLDDDFSLRFCNLDSRSRTNRILPPRARSNRATRTPRSTFSRYACSSAVTWIIDIVFLFFYSFFHSLPSTEISGSVIKNCILTRWIEGASVYLIIYSDSEIWSKEFLLASAKSLNREKNVAVFIWHFLNETKMEFHSLR